MVWPMFETVDYRAELGLIVQRVEAENPDERIICEAPGSLSNPLEFGATSKAEEEMRPNTPWKACLKLVREITDKCFCYVL